LVASARSSRSAAPRKSPVWPPTGLSERNRRRRNRLEWGVRPLSSVGRAPPW
jgi:hypothetical protein